MALNPKMSALSISQNDDYFQSFFNKNELTVYSKLIENSVIKTSSIGRLFDAVAFTLGFKGNISFEGQTGMFLENLAQKAFYKSNVKLKDYLKDENITNIIPSKKLLVQIVKASLLNLDHIYGKIILKQCTLDSWILDALLC